jgi:hypothetical protein
MGRVALSMPQSNRQEEGGRGEEEEEGGGGRVQHRILLVENSLSVDTHAGMARAHLLSTWFDMNGKSGKSHLPLPAFKYRPFSCNDQFWTCYKQISKKSVCSGRPPHAPDAQRPPPTVRANGGSMASPEETSTASPCAYLLR